MPRENHTKTLGKTTKQPQGPNNGIVGDPRFLQLLHESETPPGDRLRQILHESMGVEGMRGNFYTTGIRVQVRARNVASYTPMMSSTIRL
jgi:hypothetical protein